MILLIRFAKLVWFDWSIFSIAVVHNQILNRPIYRLYVYAHGPTTSACMYHHVSMVDSD